MVQTQFIGTAFSAVPTQTVNYNKDDLKNETINLKNTTETQKSDFSYKTNKDKDVNNLVAFNDPTNNKLVVVSLEDSTLNKLKSHFGENDFFSRNDGITRLNSEAEAFVSGWFGDIAYKREFLNADRNQDGNLDSDEYLNTKNDFNGSGEVLTNSSVKEIIEKTYMKISENQSNIVRYNRDEFIRPDSIDEELNTTLGIDKNFDSRITLRESYNKNFKVSSMTDEQLGHAHIKEAVKKGILPEDALEILEKLNKAEDKKSKEEKEKALEKLMNSDSLSVALDIRITKELDTKIQRFDKEDKKLETLNKLQQNNGNDLKLTQEEKELIEIEIQKSKNEDGLIDIDKLEEVINYFKTSQLYNEEKQIQLGKYYQDKG